MRDLKTKNDTFYIRNLILERTSDSEEGVYGFILYWEENQTLQAHFLIRKCGDRFLLSSNLSPKNSFGIDVAEVRLGQEEIFPGTVNRTLYQIARLESKQIVDRLNIQYRNILTLLEDITGYTENH